MASEEILDLLSASSRGLSGEMVNDGSVSTSCTSSDPSVRYAQVSKA